MDYEHCAIRYSLVCSKLTASRAILFSGSYMFYGAHTVRLADDIFECWQYVTPNFSLRMGNLPAALAQV